MKKKFEMKEAAFNQKNITKLADNILSVSPEFNHLKFLEMTLPHLTSLELKERSTLIEDALIATLDNNYKTALQTLLKALPQEIQKNEVTGYEGFIIMPQTGYVARCGMDDFDLSMKALYEMTKRFTAEFHIRFFIEAHYEKTMSVLQIWHKDKSTHVRRLVSEGTRPRLPWAFRLNRFIENPKPLIDLLNNLKNDKELYVRRSVANNLNDISKDHPKLVTQTLKSWQDGSKNMTWLIKHALRSLLKAGDKEALALLGYISSKKLSVNLSLDKKTISLGESLPFNIKIGSKETKELPIMVDFTVYYKKANGKLTPKVFKLTQKTIKPMGLLEINKKHKFADFTTRKHYFGEHKIAIIINGIEYEKESFSLNQT